MKKFDLLAILSAMCLGTTGIFWHYLLKEISIHLIWLISFWSLGGALLLLIFISLRGQYFSIQDKYTQMAVFSMGILGGFISWFVMIGIKEIGPAQTSSIMLSMPLFVLFYSTRVLKESLCLREWIGIGVIFLGLIWMKMTSNFISGSIILLILLAAFLGATEKFLSKKVISKGMINPLSMNFFRLLTTGVLFGGIGVFLDLEFSPMSAKDLGIFGAGIFLGPVASFLLYYYSLQGSALIRSEAFQGMAALFTIIYAAIILPETIPQWRVMFGGVIIILGAIVLYRSKEEKK